MVRTWEIKTINSRRIMNKVLNEYSFFGDEEILNETLS